jgi:hypothetical protein
LSLHTSVFSHRPLHTPTKRLLPIGSPGEPSEEEKRANESRRTTFPVTVSALYDWHLGCLILPSHALHMGFLLCCFTTLKIDVIYSSEASVHIISTRRYIAEDGNVHCGCEKLKSKSI